VGTGANAGLVRIRFHRTDLEGTTTTFNNNLLRVEYAEPTGASIAANTASLASIASQMANLSVSSRVVPTLPTTISTPEAGDQWVRVDVLLYDANGVAWDSWDHDGGSYNSSTDYPINHRVYADNGGTRYLFRLTTEGSSGGCTAPTWTWGTNDTMQDSCSNTWTNLGTYASAWANEYGDKMGFGVLARDDAGNNWELYSDNTGTPLTDVSECYHRTQSIKPQALQRDTTGIYYFWMNVDYLEASGSRHFFFSWFDRARGDVAYAGSDHRKELRSMVVDSFASGIRADVTNILNDTNELQTDWANGGRLDLILDSAGAAGDPWPMELPGSYAPGTAGYFLGNMLSIFNAAHGPGPWVK
jgi:hypothetical protein